MLLPQPHLDEDAAELRSVVARCPAPQYVLAADARIHPSQFSRLLRGRAPITAEIRARILDAVRRATPKRRAQ